MMPASIIHHLISHISEHNGGRSTSSMAILKVKLHYGVFLYSAREAAKTSCIAYLIVGIDCLSFSFSLYCSFIFYGAVAIDLRPKRDLSTMPSLSTVSVYTMIKSIVAYHKIIVE